MMTFLKRWSAGYLVVVLLMFSSSMTSCLTQKKVLYFTDLPDTMVAGQPTVIAVNPYKPPVILSNDVLLITVQTLQQNESNTPTSMSTGAVFNPLSGSLVDQNGNVELALIGFVKVAGLTTSEARELVKEKAKEFYKDPVVNVRIANFDINFMGDFGKAGTVSFPSEKVNIIEAIAAAGDLQITAKRNNILLIRTEGDQKKFIRFNMSSSDIFKSEYFYLRQRDILYASPNRIKIQNSDNTITRNVGIISSVLSLIAVFLAFRSK